MHTIEINVLFMMKRTIAEISFRCIMCEVEHMVQYNPSCAIYTVSHKSG